LSAGIEAQPGVSHPKQTVCERDLAEAVSCPITSEVSRIHRVAAGA